ncbi:MAG: NAD(P)/FAD-dependent oxidoreductase [Gemmatimonadetes bacterium]|nr:NAD(P)/FAD-dependent oxidoreductase [Gemmatimonadota bacterium]
MSQSFDAIVIGAGQNGLVTSAYLARAGRNVLVLEQRDRVGGGASTEELFPGFRFDTGAHRAAQLHPAISRDLDLSAHGLEMIPSDPAVFAPLADGRHLLLSASPPASTESIRAFSATDADRWADFNGFAGMVARFLTSIFSVEPPEIPRPSASDMRLLARIGFGLRKLGRREMEEVVRVLPMSCLELLDEWFESEPLRGVLAGVAVQGGAHGPMATGTALSLFRRATGSGSGSPATLLRPRGGVGRLSEALASAARGAGVEIRLDRAVKHVRLREGRAAGVVLEDGTEISAPTVASGVGPGVTLLGLSDPATLDPEFVRALKAVRYRGATAKVHLALGELPRFDSLPGSGPHLSGAISISPSLEYVERASDAAKYGRISDEPYLEAVIPTVAEPDLAPDGKHGMSVLVQYAPYHLRSGTWDAATADRLADTVIDTLGRYAPNVPGSVEARHVLTPAEMERRWGLQEGSMFQGEMTLDQFFFARPVAGWARYRTPIEGLYLCGAGTHPGGGATGTSGYLAARRILKDAKERR